MSVQNEAILEAIERAVRARNTPWVTVRQVERELPEANPTILKRQLADLARQRQLIRAQHRGEAIRYRIPTQGGKQ